MNEIVVRKKEELDPQEKSFRRRKDLIKNFIIVFLVVMLILTFFSNTIMNYSLPRVAVQYVQPGSITSVIRGQGMVESGDPYNVMVKQSKTVGSIKVKSGQEVKEGDILISLEAEDSQELADAKNALDEAKEAYNKILLSDKVNSAIIASSQGNVDVNSFRTSITNAQNAITTAEKGVDDCQTVVDNLNNQITITSGTTVTEAEKTAVDNLKTASDNAATALTEAEADLTIKKAVVESCETALTAAQGAKEIAKQNLDAAQADYDSLSRLKGIIDRMVAGEEISQEDTDFYNSFDLATITSIADKLFIAGAALDEAQGTYDTVVAEEPDKIAAANAALDQAKANRDAAQRTRDDAAAVSNSAYTNWKNANDAITAKQNNASDSVTNLRNQLSVAQINLANAQKTLEEKKTALSDLISDIGSIRELTDAQAAIDKAKANVDKLQEQSGASDVICPINGTVISVNVSSGKKTSTDEPVVVLQPEGQGYTMKFSLENEKAKTVSIGDTAEVTNSWWYNDVTGSVASIRPDPSDPNRQKEITLNLQGSLVNGQNLTMSISSRTSNYDYVVPSSAVRNDNKGDYVLVIESKASPLGNRYFANRYDVEVLATDDTQTAINGNFSGYEYVVTTASKPIDEGAQVRLPD